MKILVTGRDGQLARCLADRAGLHPDITLERVGRPALDLERPETIASAIENARPDVVVSAAAYTAVDQAEDEPDRAFLVNAEAAGALAEAARNVGAPIIHVSTDYVFDGNSQAPLDENAPTRPIGIYGKSKLAGEEAVRRATLDHVIVRTAWVYSPYGRNFVKTMLGLAAGRPEINVVADQWGNPSAAHDIADGILAILSGWRNGGAAGLGETYHLAGTGTASWHGFAEHIFAEAARLGLPSARANPIATADWPTKARRPAFSMLNSSRFTADFGYAMPDWRQSTTRVIEALASASPPD